MSEEIYRKLAQRLDTIPNGFSATESGVELRILAKIFTPEEAALATVMRMTCESAADIGVRAGLDAKTAYRRLKKMTRKGQIHIKKGEGEILFGLMPFAVGFYEEQLPRLDVELATLIEQYFLETQGGSNSHSTPAINRVAPVEEAIPADLEIYPYERATAMLEAAKSWGVRDCICRVQQKLVGKGCEQPVENCVVFAPSAGVFDYSKTDRAITKDEALRILREAEEAGLVHTAGNYRDDHHYICNCCTCCCGILRGVAEFGAPSAVAHSDFHAVVDADLCSGCEDCIERCQFDALAVPDDVCEVDYARCVGCGVCTIVCPTDALRLERRPEGKTLPLATDDNEWMVWRAEERGIQLGEIL